MSTNHRIGDADATCKCGWLVRLSRCVDSPIVVHGSPPRYFLRIGHADDLYLLRQCPSCGLSVVDAPAPLSTSAVAELEMVRQRLGGATSMRDVIGVLGAPERTMERETYVVRQHEYTSCGTQGRLIVYECSDGSVFFSWNDNL